MLTLYEHPLSPYAQKIKIALLEKGLEFEARLPSGLGSGIEPDAGFADENPRLEVPLLVDGEARLFDSTVILEYLEDRWPTPSLLPPEALDRARARTIEEVMDTHYEAVTWGLAEIRYFGRATGDQADTLLEAAGRQLRRLHDWLQGRLGEEAWLNGEAFGWADLVTVPFLNGAAGFGLGPVDGSRLADWQRRANDRASVARVASEAAAAILSMSAVAEVLESGLFKRQYRDHRLEWMIRSGGVGVVLDGLEKRNIRFTDFG